MKHFIQLTIFVFLVLVVTWLQLTLMWEAFLNANGIALFIMTFPLHESPLQATPSPIPRIQNGLFDWPSEASAALSSASCLNSSDGSSPSSSSSSSSSSSPGTSGSSSSSKLSSIGGGTGGGSVAAAVAYNQNIISDHVLNSQFLLEHITTKWVTGMKTLVISHLHVAIHEESKTNTRRQLRSDFNSWPSKKYP